jgi:uncharacterized protein YprB with RNaseH-like and TPR domain
MLENTFCHIRGIGPITEHQLWSDGVPSWEAALTHEHLALSPTRAVHLRRSVQESIAHLDRDDAGFFFQRLPTGQQWRAFPEFRHSVAYLDIETTGLGGPDLSNSGDHITTISIYDGRSISCYVHGHNLDAFREDIARYALIVTYNGKCFDVPFIENSLGIALPQAHIDLRYVLASLGYRGGLKGCERQLGLDRQDLQDVDGFFAVLLWDDFQDGNMRALETLLAYNILDVVNLEALMVIAYNLKLQGTPFVESHRLPRPVPPPNPFHADRVTIERIRRDRVGWYAPWLRR